MLLDLLAILKFKVATFKLSKFYILIFKVANKVATLFEVLLANRVHYACHKREGKPGGFPLCSGKVRTVSQTIWATGPRACERQTCL